MESNFAFLKVNENELYELCEDAEIMLEKDSNFTMYKLRQFIEILCKNIISRRNLKYDLDKRINLDDKIYLLRNNKVIDEALFSEFTYIRKFGNKAIHDLHESYNDALIALEDAHKIAVWYYKSFYSPNFKPSVFSLTKTNNIIPITDDTIQKNRGIGNYVKSQFINAFEKNLLTEKVILNLQDKEYSKRVFSLSSFPIIKKFDTNISIKEQRFINGHARFYDLVLAFNKEQYLLCSQWMYEKHFEKLKAWFSNITQEDFEYEINTFNIVKQEKNKKVQKEKINLDSDYLMRLIRTVGMSTFVKYYNCFRDINFSDYNIIKLFEKNNEGYMESSEKTKAYVGRKIFQEGLQLDALKIISNAAKVDSITVRNAKEILEKEKQKLIG